MAAKHTPGPWSVQGDDRPGMQWNRHIHSSPNVAVCFMAHSDGKDNARDEANASLIAAAPELLEALQEVVAFCERNGLQSDAYDTARAAIAKATGSAA
jgi:hypothetical protein